MPDTLSCRGDRRPRILIDMANPLPANATLIFKSPTGAQTIDALGNPTKSAPDLTVQAYLKRVNNRNAGRETSLGSELNKVYLEGYVVSINGLDPNEAQVLPGAIVGGAKATATFTGEWLTGGDFFLEADIPSPFPIVEQILGRKLRGYLIQTVAWGEAR